MKSSLPPATYLLASRVCRYVVERMAANVADQPIREAKEYLVRHVLDLLTPHGAWTSCPVPIGEMIETVQGMVAEALVDDLARTVTSEGGP